MSGIKKALIAIYCVASFLLCSGMMFIAGSAGTAGGGGGGPDSYDYFTDTDSTALTSHTSDSSDTWGSNGSGDAALITSNQLHSSVSGSLTTYNSSFTPTDADYSVYADIHVSSTSSTSGLVCARLDDPQRTGYCVRYSTGTWTLYRFDNGSPTTLGSGYTGDDPTTTRTVELFVSGTSITVEIDSVQRISETDSGISDAGNPGIAHYYTDTGSWMDNWGTND